MAIHREQTISTLNRIADDPFMKAKCDYWASVCSDAAMLLKADGFLIEELTKQTEEHEVCANCSYKAVKPEWRQGKAYCGACGKRIPMKIKAHYCHKCGRKVWWG